MGKMDNVKNFKVDDEFQEYLAYLCMTLHDWSLSEIIRQSILIAAPFIIEHPDCAKRIGVIRPKSQ